jgi:hypothetical protein
MVQTRDEDEEVFKEAVKSILEYMKTRAKAYLEYRLRPHIDLAKQTWQLRPEFTSSFHHLFAFDSEIMKIGSVQKCLDNMVRKNFPRHLGMEIKDKDGKPAEGPDFRPFLFYETLGPFVDRYLKSHDSQFIYDSFKKMYDEMISYVYSKSSEVVIVAPLYNFDVKEIDSFSVNNYKVRKLKESEIGMMIESGRAPGTTFSQGAGTIEASYCIERVIDAPKRVSPAAEPYISDLVTVLRIYKNGAVKYDNILQYKIGEAGWGLSWSPKSTFKLGPRYSAEGQDIPPLNSLFQDYARAKDHLPNPVKFSIRWFNKSYEEPEIMDTLLDLATALEVLFGVSDRLDLYVSHFIGSNTEERITLNRDIVQLRKARGNILHAGNYKTEERFVNRIEDILRLCLQKFLRLLRNQSYKEIKTNIKSSIIE